MGYQVSIPRDPKEELGYFLIPKSCDASQRLSAVLYKYHYQSVFYFCILLLLLMYIL